MLLPETQMQILYKTSEVSADANETRETVTHTQSTIALYTGLDAERDQQSATVDWVARSRVHVLYRSPVLPLSPASESQKKAARKPNLPCLTISLRVFQTLCKSFFAEGIINVWNLLPSSVSFSSLRSFTTSIKGVDFCQFLISRN